MQFRKIRSACLADGYLVRAQDLTLRSRGPWYCKSCGNPLRLYWTHTEGSYFEHDLELAEDARLSPCEYLQASSPKSPSPSAQAVHDILQRDNTMLGRPTDQYYWCVHCEYEYYGPKTCPNCEEWLFTTEKKNLAAQTVPEKKAR